MPANMPTNNDCGVYAHQNVNGIEPPYEKCIIICAPQHPPNLYELVFSGTYQDCLNFVKQNCKAHLMNNDSDISRTMNSIDMDNVSNIGKLIHLIIDNDEIDLMKPNYSSWVIGYCSGINPIKGKSRGHCWRISGIGEVLEIAKLLKPDMEVVPYKGREDSIDTFYLYHR